MFWFDKENKDVLYMDNRQFNEVLCDGRTLNIKWNEDQVPLKEVLQAIDYRPLFGNRRSKTHWLVFMKD